MKRYLPISSWLPNYKGKWFRADLIAGLTITALLVPEGMAYAELAGVPPQTAFYAAPIGLLLYAAFGSSRQLVVAVSSGIAVMSASIVGGIASPDSTEYITLTAGLAILAGVVALVAGLLRFGRIARFFSHSVLIGFVSGLAIFIIVKQLPKVFGLESGEGNTFERIIHLIGDLPEADGLTLLVGAGTAGVMLLVEKRFHRIPAALVALAFGIVIVTVLGLDEQGVHVVGEIPAGLAPPQLPDLSLADFGLMFTGALALTLFMFAEAVAPARRFATRHGYRIDDNQELIGLGMANLGAGLFQGFSIGASLSKSAASEAAGARTQVAGVIAAAATALVALFLTPIFRNLPEAALGAIVVIAVSGMFNYHGLRRLYEIRKIEFGLAVLAFIGVLWFDEVVVGLLVAVLVSLLALVLRASSPKMSELVRMSGRLEFRNAIEHPDGLRTEGLTILRPDEGMFFANAEALREQIRQYLDKAVDESNAVLLDLSLSHEIDLQAAAMLAELARELDGVGIELRLASVRAGVASLLDTSGALEVIGRENLFADVSTAVISHVRQDNTALTADDLEAFVSRIETLAEILQNRGDQLTSSQRAELESAVETLRSVIDQLN